MELLFCMASILYKEFRLLTTDIEISRWKIQNMVFNLKQVVLDRVGRKKWTGAFTQIGMLLLNNNSVCYDR